MGWTLYDCWPNVRDGGKRYQKLACSGRLDTEELGYAGIDKSVQQRQQSTQNTHQATLKIEIMHGTVFNDQSC